MMDITLLCIAATVYDGEDEPLTACLPTRGSLGDGSPIRAAAYRNAGGKVCTVTDVQKFVCKKPKTVFFVISTRVSVQTPWITAQLSVPSIRFNKALLLLSVGRPDGAHVLLDSTSSGRSTAQIAAYDAVALSRVGGRPMRWNVSRTR
ncbi:hypothetical protein [Paraburkholderia phenazinium]|uniref:hypothetical protein n=1 Tax=Paraburkholderia phenazinium TaxID=60549 RepID=UPI00117FFFDE|nr:hypothetical protein [Paraburkholderia phenazinium]